MGIICFLGITEKLQIFLLNASFLADCPELHQAIDGLDQQFIWLGAVVWVISVALLVRMAAIQRGKLDFDSDEGYVLGFSVLALLNSEWVRPHAG